MASVKIFSGAILGLESFPIEIEVDSTPGLHSLNIVGLPDKSIQESADRINAAIKNSGFIAPNQKSRRVVVNLAPADVKKEGSSYDLPIALGYLLSTDQVKFQNDKYIFLGELSLDGSLRRVNGVLAVALMAKRLGFQEIVVPPENIKEATIICGIKVVGAKNLKQLISHLTGERQIEPSGHLNYEEQIARNGVEETLDISQVRGQEAAKRALLIAAAGGHNLLFYGPPGSGKTLLAKSLAGILPPMGFEEALEVTNIYSICGLTNNKSIITSRPFRNPHHTTSSVAVIGGGAWPRPGEISLAHRGVLFLDEMPEFPRNVIESLRQPMESGEISIARASGSVKFPSRFILVAAMNPCPCGNYGDEAKPCSCTPQTIYRYQRKISGPLLDRIDMQISVPQETYANLSQKPSGLTNIQCMATVKNAREKQMARFSGTRLKTNGEMGPKEIEKFCAVDKDADSVIESVMLKYGLSGRGYHKLLKIARTIADMAESDIITSVHMAEAVSYRIRQEDSSLS